MFRNLIPSTYVQMQKMRGGKALQEQRIRVTKRTRTKAASKLKGQKRDLLDFAHEGLEREGLGHSKLCKHLPIESDVRPRQAVHELGIGQPCSRTQPEH